MTPARLATLLQGFFTQRLLAQQGASPHTVASYRDTFRLLLTFAARELGRAPSRLCLDDLGASFLVRFLEHVEQERGCSVRTRNIRRAGIRAFFRYVAFEEPASALQCQRVLAIPPKRAERRSVEYLTDKEVAVLLAAPDPSTWIGRRDRALLLVAVRTGLRNAELTALRREDVSIAAGAHVRCHGKGRKSRCTPLHRDVVPVLRSWLEENVRGCTDHVFPSSRGGRMSADALQRLVAKHVAAAAGACPSLAERRITPHCLRHTSAMEMLRDGVDRSVIALWLGHESMETTQIYLHGDMRLKERALAHATDSGLPPGRFEPDDALLEFLEGL